MRSLPIGVLLVAGGAVLLACADEPQAPTLAPLFSDGGVHSVSGNIAASMSSPDIIVNTTLDVGDFGGGQQVGDLPGPDGVVSLREGIIAANNTTGPQGIGFNIPTTDAGFDGTVFTIRPLSRLPSLVGGGTTINGATQTAFTGNTNPSGPEVVIDGTSASLTPGLIIDSDLNAVHGLAVIHFSEHGILVFHSRNQVTGCFVGVGPDGTTAAGNGQTTGSDGIHIGGSDNVIGGTTPELRNIISSNFRAGVSLSGTGNVVQGNFIGPNASGTMSVGGGNEDGGIAVFGGNGNLIGGTVLGAGNVISGNRGAGPMDAAGIFIVTGNDNRIQGNYIGTNATGTAALPNHNGIEIFAGVSGTLIGGAAPQAANLISGNVHDGVDMRGDNNVIQGNRIGTDVTGTIVLGNSDRGTIISGSNNAITGNLISGNTIAGLSIGSGGTGTRVEGNLIGTDRTGTLALGNIGFGILITEGSSNVIGGATPGARNVVSGNTDNGVAISGNGNRVIGNFIGTDITGNSPLPNGTSGGGLGVQVVFNATGNTIERNLIAHNLSDGIAVGFAAVRNRITKNSIFSNDGLGIDLGSGSGDDFHGDGVTPDDPGDTDVGPNNLMNFPMLRSALGAPGQVVVKGTIDTPNPRGVTIEFFGNPVPTPGGDPSGHGEGAVFLGTVRPDARGGFTATLPPMPVGTLITATATDASGNTSEFAANVAARAPSP